MYPDLKTGKPDAQGDMDQKEGNFHVDARRLDVIRKKMFGVTLASTFEALRLSV